MSKIPFKKGCVTKIIFKISWSINCQEQFAYPVYGEYVFQMFNSLFLSKINFPSKRQFSQKILLGLMEKKNELYVLPTLAECHFATVSFDLWMSKRAYDVFTLVINFLNNDW